MTLPEPLDFKGTLIPIGGNENKGLNEGEGLDFIERGILSRVVQESGGEGCNVVVIPTASSIPEIVGDNYSEAFRKLGSGHVQVLDIRKRAQSNAEGVLRVCREAQCIMFSGGDQSRIAKIIGGTALHTLLSQRFLSESVVIAGTSAGAMAMASEMIAGGSSTDAMLKGAVIMRNGLSLLPDLIIDTHFIQRGRFGRLAEAVAMFPDKVGIGLAEDTGLVIKNREWFSVIGSGMVIVMDPGQIMHNNHAILEHGMPMSISNLTTHILAYGDTFRMTERSVQVMDINKWKAEMRS